MAGKRKWLIWVTCALVGVPPLLLGGNLILWHFFGCEHCKVFGNIHHFAQAVTEYSSRHEVFPSDLSQLKSRDLLNPLPKSKAGKNQWRLFTDEATSRILICCTRSNAEGKKTDDETLRSIVADPALTSTLELTQSEMAAVYVLKVTSVEPTELARWDVFRWR